jgi:DNA polymerase
MAAPRAADCRSKRDLSGIFRRYQWPKGSATCDALWQGGGMDEALALLRLQIDWGADEAIEDAPPDRTRVAGGARAVRPPAAVPLAAAPVGVAGRAEQAAAACVDLLSLRDALAGFDGLELRHTAGQFVFGDGPETARLMIAVEAPSAEDDEAGTPLAGGRGRLLEAMLRSIGLRRDEVRVACLLPWRPPGGRPPSPVEIGACAPFLRAHLRLLPSVAAVAMMGGTVAKTLGGAEGRGWRGRWFEVDAGEGAAGERGAGERGRLPGLAMSPLEVIAAEGKARAAAWTDLLSLRRRLEGVVFTPP